MRGEVFFFAVLALSGVLLSVFLRDGRRLWQPASPSEWDQLLARLLAINRENLLRVTLDPLPLQEDAVHGGQWRAEEPDLWALIGGLRGLERLQANCDVLIALACVMQQRYPEALVVAERLRLDARQIQWHVERLRGAERIGKLTAAFPDYAERAVTTYQAMTARLLALYEIADATRYAELKRVL